MQRVARAVSFWAFCISLPACGGVPAEPKSEAVPASTAPAPLVQQPRPHQPSALDGLTPCARDAPEGSGCATHSGNAAPGTTAAAGQAPSGQAEKPEKKIDATVWRVPIGRDDPAKGGRDAIVTLVVFSDFQCPFCKHGARTLDRVLREYPEDTRLVWKDLPLPMHEHAEAAAEFARAARARLGDDGFWAAHDFLYDEQDTLGDATYERIAGKLGVPWAQTRAAIKAARYGALIQSGVVLSDRVDVPATPTTFVNGRKVVGAQPYDVLKEVVDEELAKAKDLVARGLPRKDVYATIIQAGKDISPPSDGAKVPLPPP
jgi:protein-disulfide isomerase